MTADVTFTPDRAGQERLLHSESGPMGQYLTRLANQVKNGAQERANVDTGYMRSRIEYRITVEGGVLVAYVVAATNYSLYVHEGHGSYPGNPFLTDALRAVLAQL